MMNIHINGYIFDIVDNYSYLNNASNLSMDDNCIALYIQEESDKIIFIDTEKCLHEIIDINIFLNSISEKKNIGFIKSLFLNSMFIQGNVENVELINATELVSIDSSRDIRKNSFINKNGVLHVYIPNMVGISDKKISKRNIKQNDNIKKENIFTKQLTFVEKRKLLIEYLKLNEDIYDLFFCFKKNVILKVNKITGESVEYNFYRILNNPNLCIESIDDLLSFGLFKASINASFDSVSICDIRHAFSLFENPNMKIKNMNFVVNNNILYIVYADISLVEEELTLKEYSIKIYRESVALWNKYILPLEKNGVIYFYVYRNQYSDYVVEYNSYDKTSNFIYLKDFLNKVNCRDFDLMDVSKMFLANRIIDLNHYGIDDIKGFMECPIEYIKKLQLNKINDDDEISFGLISDYKMIGFSNPKY